MEKKVMSDYICYCTIEQVKRAIKLNAPIKECMSRYNAKTAYLDIAKGNSSLDEYQKKGIAIIKTSCSVRAYKIPTAEEMIGWLEEQLIQTDVCGIVIGGGFIGSWYYIIGVKESEIEYDSRKEATIAAIDAALDYLTKII